MCSFIDGKKNVDLESDCKRVLEGKECLDLSFQLYAMSWILEIYYAQNFEPKYIENVKEDIINDIYSRRDDIRDSFMKLKDRLSVAKSSWFKASTQEDRRKIRADYRKQVDDIIRSLELPNGDWLSSLTDPVYSALDTVTKKRNYYLSSSGEVYTEKLPE